MILVVDDSSDNATALCRVLEERRYPCRVAPDGIQALAMIHNYPRKAPLLVVLDQMMPEMSGIDVVRALRDDPATADIPVIMYTAGLNLSAREPAMAMGVSSWLLKAEDMPTIVDTIIAEYEKAGGMASEPARVR